jgi:hypothetical protein
MITHELAGGLGNQLYQIVTTIALAMRTNQSFFFIYSDKLGIEGDTTTVRSTYWNTLLKGLKKYTLNKNEYISAITYRRGEIFYIKETNQNYNRISLQNSNKTYYQDIFNLISILNLNFKK